MGQSAERHQKNFLSSKVCLKEIGPIACELKGNKEISRQGRK
jgi:hypothetical protein